MEPRSKRLAEVKLLAAVGLSLLMVSILLLASFLAELKHILGESAALLFFSAMFLAFSFVYFVEYIREYIRRYIDARLNEVLEEIRKRTTTP